MQHVPSRQLEAIITAVDTGRTVVVQVPDHINMNTVKTSVSSVAFCRPAAGRFQPLSSRRVSACVLAPPKGVTEPSREPVQPPGMALFLVALI